MPIPTLVQGAAPMPAPTSLAGMSLPMIDPTPGTRPMPRLDAGAAVVAVSPAYLRRCVFRRMTVVGATRTGRRSEPSYAVECLFAGPQAPVALGDLASARTACTACTYPGRFRADED